MVDFGTVLIRNDHLGDLEENWLYSQTCLKQAAKG